MFHELRHLHLILLFDTDDCHIHLEHHNQNCMAHVANGDDPPNNTHTEKEREREREREIKL